MGKPSSPKPPDPVAISNAAADANQQTAITQSLLNMVNQDTPWGSLTYKQRGTVDGVPQFTARTALSPDQRAIFNRTEGNQLEQAQLIDKRLSRVANVLNSPFQINQGAPSASLPDRSNRPGLPGAQSVPGFDQLAQMLGVPDSIRMNLPQGGQIPGLPDLSGLPGMPEANDEVRQRTEDAMFQRAKAQLDPVFEERARRLETQLVNQGFARGSEAYNNALERFRQSESDAYQSALNDAIMFGGQEQSRLFGLESGAREQAFNELAGMFGMGAQQFGMGEQQRTRALNERLAQFETESQRFGMSQAQRQQGIDEILQQFGMGQQVFDENMRRRQQIVGEQDTRFDQALGRRQQAISENVLQRNQPLNELLALMGQAGQVGMPQWNPTPQTGVASTDVLGANALNQQGQWNQFNAQQQQQGGLMGTLGNLAGTALSAWMLSDPDAKENRAPFKPGRALEGMRNIPVEAWNYKGDPQRRVGPMADAWANQFGGDGKTIDTVSAFGMSMGAIQALADKVDKLERKRG